jgi:hypothetical protein
MDSSQCTTALGSIRTGSRSCIRIFINRIIQTVGLGGKNTKDTNSNTTGLTDIFNSKKKSEDESKKEEDPQKKPPLKEDKPDKDIETIIALIEEIRKNIIKGIETSKKDIEDKIRESANNKSLQPHLAELRPIFDVKTPDELYSEAEKIMNTKDANTLVKGVCGAIINRVNEFKFYETLHSIFNVSAHPETEYVQILKNYVNHRNSGHINNRFKLMNKHPAQTDAKKIIDKIELAIRLLNKKLGYNS